MSAARWTPKSRSRYGVLMATDTRRTMLIVASVLGALLVAVIVLLIVVLNTMQDQANEADYRSCLASYGVVPGSTDPRSTDVEYMAETAEHCYSSVYGD